MEIIRETPLKNIILLVSAGLRRFTQIFKFGSLHKGHPHKSEKPAGDTSQSGINIQIIGFVRNEWNEAQPFEANKIMQSISTIEVKEAFADGLFKIENQSELHIIWQFHRSKGYALQTTTRSGDFRGVFACCSPRRPSAIGLTRVKLLRREGNMLFVAGLDALNGTPVLDIKPYVEPSEILKQAGRQ